MSSTVSSTQFALTVSWYWIHILEPLKWFYRVALHQHKTPIARGPKMQGKGAMAGHCPTIKRQAYTTAVQGLKHKQENHLFKKKLLCIYNFEYHLFIFFSFPFFWVIHSKQAISQNTSCFIYNFGISNLVILWQNNRNFVTNVTLLVITTSINNMDRDYQRWREHAACLHISMWQVMLKQ